MAHYLDAAFNAEPSKWTRLGKDLEEYSVELNPDTETSKNILGESTFKHNGYEASSEADPYYAVVGDPLFEHLQEIVDTRATGDTCKTSALEVHLWDGDETSGFVAWKQPCYVIPNSYGGDTSGYQIPFSVNYVEERVKGKFVPSTGTFTPDTTPASQED